MSKTCACVCVYLNICIPFNVTHPNSVELLYSANGWLQNNNNNNRAYQTHYIHIA